MSNTTSNDALIVPIFKIITTPNEAKSAEAGRPIFDDMEVCEIRFGGDRQKISVFPAHAFSANVTGVDGMSIPMTYAERFSDQYRRFKQSATQVMEGTPVDELPFLTQAKRSELKALNIHTAETLAALDGTPLKTLGIGGRELKNQAVAYLQNAAGSADVTRLAAENESLRAQLAAMSKPTPRSIPEDTEAFDKPEGDDEDPLAALTIDELKDRFEDLTGAKPRGNPNKATMRKLIEEAQANAE